MWARSAPARASRAAKAASASSSAAAAPAVPAARAAASPAAASLAARAQFRSQLPCCNGSASTSRFVSTLNSRLSAASGRSGGRWLARRTTVPRYAQPALRQSGVQKPFGGLKLFSATRGVLAMAQNRFFSAFEGVSAQARRVFALAQASAYRGRLAAFSGAVVALAATPWITPGTHSVEYVLQRFSELNRRFDPMLWVAPLIAVCAAVAMLPLAAGVLKKPQLMDFFGKHFVMSLEALQAKRFHTLLASCVAHAGFIHLAFNMVALWSFGSAMVQTLGGPDFAKLLGLGFLLSSVGSALGKLAMGTTVGSVGASGGVFALVGAFVYLFPHQKLGIIFLPGVNFDAERLVLGLAAFDLVGVIVGLARGRTKIFGKLDHAGHLAGLLTGYSVMHLMEEKGRHHPSQRSTVFNIDGRRFAYEGPMQDGHPHGFGGSIWAEDGLLYAEDVTFTYGAGSWIEWMGAVQQHDGRSEAER